MAPHITITAVPPTEGVPTISEYQRFVAEAVVALDQILAVIPKIEEAEASGRKVAPGRLAVPDAFMATVISGVEQHPELAAAKKLDPVASRDKLQYIEAFRPLKDKLVTVEKRVSFALRWLRDFVAGETLQVYRIARQHASDRRSPAMAALVATMKQALGRKTPTKAEREARKAEKLKEAAAELQQKEVQKAA